jgi:hypothetical protein
MHSFFGAISFGWDGAVTARLDTAFTLAGRFDTAIHRTLLVCLGPFSHYFTHEPRTLQTGTFHRNLPLISLVLITPGAANQPYQFLVRLAKVDSFTA